MKTGAVASGALVLGGGATVAARDDGGLSPAAALNVQEDDDGDDETDETESAMFAGVEFTNQESDGTSVVVDSTTLSHGGYVAFHDGTLLEGNVVGSVIGVSEYHEAGIHYSTESTLFDVPGAEFEQTALEGTSPLVAMPHQETNDNEEYNFVTSDSQEDGPYTEAGLPVIDLGFITVSEAGAGTPTDDGTATPTDGGTPTPTDDAAATPTETATPGGDATEQAGAEEHEPFAAIDFSNQAIENDVVTVGEVTLSDGGYVALHDARLLQGDALGSVVGVSEYLEAGTHRSVDVELDADAEITEVALPAPPLIPMPHQETNDNETYDFVTSEGAEDGPYTQAGQAVVDIGLVTREAADTPTGTADGTPTETAGETPTETADGTPTEAGETPTETEAADGTPTGTPE